MSLHPFTRRNPFAASNTPAATQRSTTVPPRQRLTFRFTWRVRLRRLSTAFVVASDRWSRAESNEAAVLAVAVDLREAVDTSGHLGCYRGRDTL